MIIDDEQLPILSLDQKVASIDEGAGVTLTVSLDGKLEVPVTVSLLTGATSTAKANDDYTLSPLTFRIESGQLTATFRLNALSDKIYEGNEQLVLVPRATGDGIDLRAQPFETTITDENDRPTLQIGPVGEVIEGHSTTIEVSLTSILKVPVRVSLAYGVGSTASQSDYILSEINAEIAAGKLTATFSLEAVQNELYELTETLILVPSASGVGLEEITGEPGVITIGDDEAPPTVSLESLGQVNEPHPRGHSEMRKNTSLTVTVRLSGALESTVTVSLLATNESAEDDDYTISPASVTILPGATVAEFTLSALRNNLQQRNIEYFEGTEILTLEPVAIIVEGSVRLPTDSSVPHQVAISESLPVPELEVTVNGGPTSFNEGQQRIELVAVPDDVTEFTVTLTLRRRADSTAGDTDFELEPDTVEIGPGSVAFLYLDIIDDVIYEEDETLIFEGYATGGGIELPVRPLVTEIIDNNDPRPTLRIGEVGPLVNEGESLTFTVEVVGSANYSQTLTFRPIFRGGEGRTEEADLRSPLPDFTIAIPADRDGITPIRRFEFTIRTNQDSIYENTELFNFELILRDNNGVVRDRYDGFVDIMDDDPIPTLSLDPIEDVTEGGVFTVTVRLSGLVGFDLPITELRYVSAGSTAEMADYVVPESLQAGELKIAAGMTTAVVTFQTRPDEVYEGTETLVLRPYALSGGLTINLEGISGEVMIIDDELRPTVSLDAPGQVAEGDGITVTVRLDGVLESTVTVELLPTNGNAESDDYTISPARVTILPGATVAKFTLTAHSDIIPTFETTETLTLNPVAIIVEGSVSLDTDSSVPHQVAISENLPVPPLAFRPGAIGQFVNEGESLTFTVELMGLASETHTLTFRPIFRGGEGRAEAADLRSPLPDFTIAIPAARDGNSLIRRFEFTIRTNQDSIYENTELFNFELILRDNNGVVRDRYDGFVDIMDDEPIPTLSLDPIEDVTEGGVFTVTVRLSGLVEFDLPITELRYVSAGSTAEMADYVVPESLQAGELKIAAGMTTAVVTFQTRPDEVYEGTETLVLRPYALSGGLTINLEGISGEVMIIDDEAPPTLSFEPLNDLDEGDIGMITVRLNGAALETPLVVTVTVNTVASRINEISPVISPDEYQLIPLVSVIPAGELTATFSLETYHDGRFRGDRTLEIDLVTDNDQVVLAGGPMQVELMELDMVPVLSLDPIPDVLDTRGSFLIEINLSNLLDNDLDLELTTGLVEGSYIAFLRLIDPVEQGRVAVTGIPIGLQTGLITFRPQNVASDQTVTLALQLDDDAIKNADLNELEALGLIELGVTSRTFRILDRDVKPVLSLDPVGTIAEGSTNEVTVRLDRPLISDLTVSLTIDSAATLALDRPAEEGDYELPSTSFVIPASTLLTTFSLKSIDDDIYEGDEQFVLRLEHEPIDTDQFNLGQDTQIVTIRDGDPPELILDEVVSPVNEGDSFNLTGQLRGARVLPITLSLNTSSAASTVGSDEWSVTPQTITVPAGNQTYPFSFTVMVKEDSVYEGTERAVFEVTAVGASERVLNRESFGLVEINDTNETPEISRITIPEGVTEGETFRVVVELDDALGTYLDVSLVHDGASTAEPKDYQITPPIYRIEAGQTIATLEVEIFDDRLYELTETLVFSITASNTEARIELPMLSRSIEITESEELPRIVLRAIDDPITEGGDGVTVTVRVNGAFEVPLTLSLTTAVTSVAGTDDYSLSRETIVIPAGYKQEDVRENSGNVRVEVEFILTADTDDLYEGPEELILDLIVDTSADPRIDLNRGTFRRATTIMDVNQPPTLVLDGPTEINEGESAEYTLSLTGALGASLTVSFAPGAATTADPPDYRLPGSEIVILSGNTVAVFTLEAVPDDLYEGNEQLELVLSFSGAPVELPEIRETITIREPRPTVSLEPSSPSVNEGDGVTVTAVLNGGFTEDVDVLLEIVGGTADVADYVTPSTLRATITAGNTRFAFVITATTDGVYDGLEPETLELGLSVFGQGTPITAAVQTLTITDLETLPTLSLELPPRTVRETDGTLLLTATLSVGLDEDVELSLSVGGDVGEDDYSVAQQVTISAGDVFGTFEFVIKDDRIYEGTEAVELTLNGETTGAVVETLLPFSAEFAIVDDEGPVTIMVISPPSVLEDEEIVIEVELTAIALEDVTVTLVIAETGNAKPADYQLLDPLTRTIGAGDMETTFRIRAESDNLYEGIETIDLQFHALGGIVESTLNIIDANEPPAVRIASAQPTTVTEGASVEILVELDGVLSEREVVVDFTVSGTAVEGTDYTVPGRSVTIPSSRRTAAITLVATDDTVVYSGDASRTVELELTGASGGVTLGDSLTHTVTIIDDDSQVVPDPPGVEVVTATISPESVTLSEGASVSLEIVLESAVSVDVTLTLVLESESDGVTASDYSLTPMAVFISAGTTSAMVLLTASDDPDLETEEQFDLRLVSASSGVTVAVGRVVMVTIEASDQPMVAPGVEVVTATISPESVTLSEGASVSLEIVLESAVSVDVTLTLVLESESDGVTASDYSLTPMAVFISAGTTSAMVLLTASDDPDLETEEQFDLRLVSASSGVTVAVGRVVMVTIEASDQPMIAPGVEVVTATISPESVTLSEGASVSLEIVLESAASVDVTLTLVLENESDGVTASDYSLTPTAVFISAGMTSAMVLLTASDDPDLEAEEQFDLRLVSASSGVTVAVGRVVMVTIEASDQPMVAPGVEVVTATISPESVTLSEGASVSLEIVLESAVSVDVTLTLVLENESDGVTASDYSLTPTAVFISAGMTSAMVLLTASDDPDLEAEEQFDLRLVSVSSGVTVAARRVVPVTILENDRPPVVMLEATDVEFVVTSALIDEGEEYEIELRLVDSNRNPLSHSQDIEVTLEVVNNLETTLSTDEYLLDGERRLSTMVNIPANEITGTVLFQSVEDNADEPDEHITLRISAADQVSWQIGRTLRINVRDDDDPVQDVTATLSVSTLDIREDEQQTILVKLSEAPASTVTVELTRLSGSAGTDDYSLSPRLLTFTPSGSLELSALISGVLDSLYEGPEDVVFELSVLSGPAVVGVTDTVTVKIADGDTAPTVSFDIADSTVDEGDTANVVVMLSVRSQDAVAVNFMVSGSAMVGADYTTPGTSVTIPTNSDSTTITFAIKDESRYDGVTETVILTLTSATGDVTVGATNVHTLTIDDRQNRPTLSLDPIAAVAEGGTRNVVARLSGALDENVIVTLTATPGTAGTDDYSLVQTSVTIPSGTLEATFMVSATDDDVYEGNEDLTLSASAPGVTGTPSRDLTIMEMAGETAPTLSLGTVATVDEGTSIEIVVNLSGAYATDIEVTLELLSGGTATESEDYTRPSQLSMMISAGITMVTFTIATKIDNLYEGMTPETLMFRITSSDIGGGPLSGTAMIMDVDSAPTVSFDIADSTVDEGDTANVVVMLSGRSQDAVTVNFMVSGSAMVGADYTTPGTSVTIPANSDSTMITFAIKDESRYDGVTETVILTLTSATGDVTVGATNVHTLTIDDRQNRPTLSLDPVAAVAEGGTRNVVARLSGALDENVIVTLTATPGTAGTDDYSLVQTSVTIPSGTLEATFMVSATDDDVYEGNEDLTLSASAPGVTGTPARDLTIMEMAGETAPTLSLGTVATVDEGTSIEIVVNLSGAYATDIEVTLELLSGGTATESEDYTRPSQLSMMIPSGSTMVTFTIATIDDTLYEGTTPETLMFRVTSSDIGGGPLSGTAMIMDVDSAPTVSFDIADSTVDEGDTANVVIMLSGRSQDAVTVNFMVSGSAMVGADYTTPGTSVTIPANSDSTMITFAIKDESRYDGVTETVILTLTSATGDVTVGATNVHTLTIDDRQNRPTLSLDPIAAVAEGGTRNVVARLSGALDENVIVTLTATPGTAGTDDYSLVQTSVTIPSGTLEATFMVSATDDDVYEGNEDLTLSASAPGVTGTPARDLTIMEMAGETAPTLSLGTVATVDEGTSIEIVVNLSGAYATDIEVTLELLSGGTATESEDYTRPSQLSMMIPSGSTMVTFTIATIDDTLYEGTTPETLMFRVTSSDIGGGPLSGTAMIMDVDSAPTVSFDIADSTVDEGDTANVVIMLSGRSQDAVTVNFMVSGSAMVGADYTTPGTSVTIPANSDSTMITFAIKDESRYDGVTETVILTLTSATGDVTVGATNVHTLTIDDRQNRPTLSLDPIAAVAEGGTRNVVARLSGALDENVVVTLTATPGTAGTDDYSLVQTSVTIPSGTLEATFMVSATDDDVYEGNEDLTLSASAPGVTGTPTRDLTIMEMAGETAPTLSLGTVATVDEGTAIEIVVNLSGAYTTDIEVTLELLSGGTATESEDYTRPSQLSMMISAGSTMAIFRIVTVDDTLYEGMTPETLLFRVTSSDIGGGPLSGTAMIRDNESVPTVSFDIADSTVDEGTAIEIVVNLSGAYATDIEVTLELLSGGTATESEDYTRPSQLSMMISAGSTMATFRIVTKIDNLYEGTTPETLMFRITSSNANGGPLSGTAMIMDVDSAPTVSFDIADSTVDEGDTANVVVMLIGRSQDAVTVNFMVSGSAMVGADYTTPGTSVTIPANSDSTMITFAIKDENRYDGVTETVILTLTSATGDVTVGATNVHTLTIDDRQNRPTLSLDPIAAVAEGGTRNVVARLSGALDENVIVTLTATPGTAGTDDYSLVQTSVTIPSGTLEATFMVSATDDDVYEGNEDLTLSASAPGVTGTPARDLTIMEMAGETAPTLSLGTVTTVDEGTAIEIVVNLSGAYATDIEVTLELLSGGTATESEDYTRPSQLSMMIPSGSTMVTFRIVTVDDTLYEGMTPETLLFRVTSSDIGGGPLSGTAMIRDNESVPTVSFDIADSTVDEGDTANVVVMLSGRSQDAVTVNFMVSGSAMVGADYTTPGTSVTIPANSDSTMITFAIKDESRYDGVTETVILTLTSATGDVTVGATNVHTLTIDDRQNRPTLSLDPVAAVAEGGTRNVVARLSGALDENVIVTLTATPGTAGTDDYSLVQTSVTIPSGTLEATFMVSATDDDVYEGNEDLTLSASAPGVTGTPARDLTITDNDEVEIGFAPVMYTVDEDAGTIELTVRLFGGRLDRDVTLNYRAVDSTAIAGADYNTGAVSTITLSPGDTEATIMIDIVDDSLLETNETFTVVLSGAPVGVILNPDTAEVTIRGMADAIINPGDMGLYCDNISTTDPKACVRVNSMISTGPLALVIEYRSQADSIIGMGSLPDGTAVLPGAPVWDIYFEDANGNRVQTLSNTVEVEVTIPRDLVDANVDADVEARDVSIGVLHTGSVEWLTLSTSYNPVDSNYSFTASIDGFSFFNLIVPVEAEFRSTEMSVREGESIDLFVDLTVATSQDITVALNRIAGDAIEGVDYELSSLPVTIKAGMRTGRVSFTSLYDFDSQSEMVEFELSVSNGAVAGLMSRVKVRIVDNYDNDGLPPLSLNLTVPDVREGDSGVVTVELSYALPEPTEVAVRVVGGTAEMNDYELPAGSVTINAGETTAEFDLRAICDILPEGDETLMLEAIATTRLFSLTSSQSEGMIQDISIEIDGVSELDEDDDADIRVRLSGDRCNPTTVSLTVIGGTADVSDYTLLSDSEVIPAGSREARFRLIADRDREREADETLVLVASVVGLEGMMLTVTILDVDVDDGPGLLPPTGGLALPVWLLGVLALVGVLAVAVSLGGLLGRRRNRA